MIAYWSGRLYLLFPLIALDEPAPLARSLAMTRGRAWRILWVASAPIVADVLVEIAIGFPTSHLPRRPAPITCACC
jgi:hypothetical protein